MSTTTNPGLQAYIRAYDKLRLACEQTARFLTDHAVGMRPMTPQEMITLQNLLTEEIQSAESILDGYVDEALNGRVLGEIIDRHLGPDEKGIA